MDNNNENTVGASIMVNGLVKTVKVFPDFGSKINCISPKIVKEIDLTLSEKKRKDDLTDGLFINVNTVIEQIDLTLNGENKIERYLGIRY
uniref:Phage protein n=1 Tax=Strongyloides venezuelensis TaxID=75913 RepID=A0A0K0FSU0_STRVS